MTATTSRMFFTEARKYQAPLVSVKGHKKAHTDFWINSLCELCAFCGSTMAEGFGAHRFEVMRVDVVTFDHAIESLAIDSQHARGGLFVAVCML